MPCICLSFLVVVVVVVVVVAVVATSGGAVLGLWRMYEDAY